MDLFSQYNQNHPEAFREQKQIPATDEYGRAYSGMVRLVMRLSDGRIRDVKQAVRVLLIVGIAVFAVSIVIFLYNVSGSGAPVNSIPTGVDQRQFSNKQ